MDKRTLAELLGMLLFLVAWIARDLVRPFARTYSGEKGKNAATKEDVAEITKKVEEVKSAFSGDLWNKQAVLTMKRECYVGLITSLAEIERAVDHGGLDSEYAKFGTTASEEMTTAARDFVRARAIATFVLDEPANAVLDGLSPSREEDVWKWAVMAVELRPRLVAEARRELGFCGAESN